ncbi:hypothetical protein [uncultured Ilyobacter sp.]|uniref:hypothetical protein n=1 Tax=uncultured Ilyobacter sp. TaxID=544433 RepID=UPI0029C04E5B|nr:hypothetical protein [uncultured Ilyobacter sp.]
MLFILDKETKEIVKRIHPLSGSYEEIINDLNSELYAYYESDEAFKSPIISDEVEVIDEAGEKPSEYYVWDEANSVWMIPDEILNPLKEKLNEEVTTYRNYLRETSTIDYKGNLQRYRKSDLSDIDYYQNRLEKAQINAQKSENKMAIKEKRAPVEITLTMSWYFFGGTTAKLSVSDFDDLMALTDDPIERLYGKEITLKAFINGLNTVEELEKFDVVTMWSKL